MFQFCKYLGDFVLLWIYRAPSCYALVIIFTHNFDSRLVQWHILLFWNNVCAHMNYIIEQHVYIILKIMYVYGISNMLWLEPSIFRLWSKVCVSRILRATLLLATHMNRRRYKFTTWQRRRSHMRCRGQGCCHSKDGRPSWESVLLACSVASCEATSSQCPPLPRCWTSLSIQQKNLSSIVIVHLLQKNGLAVEVQK